MALTRESMGPILDRAEAAIRAIDEIDAKLGQEATGKTRLLNQLADEAAEKYGDLVSQLTDAIDEQFGRDRVALVALVRNVLRKYNDETDNFVKENVTTADQQVSADESTKLREERKVHVDVVKSVRGVIVAMDGESSELLTLVPENYTKHLRGGGSTGTRGPRLKGSWTWSVDGNEISGRTLGDVKNEVGAPNVKDLKVALETDNPGFDYESATSVSFNYNGKAVSGTKGGDTEVSADTEVDEEDGLFDDDER